MKFSFGVVLAALLLFSSARSQEAPGADVPASKQDIEKLLVTMHLNERLRLVIEDSRKQSQSTVADVLKKDFPEITGDRSSQLRELGNEMIEGIYKDYPVDEILEDMVPVYQRHLTKSDSDQLIVFYSSPVGRKVLRELPAITSEAMQVWSSHLRPRIEAAIAEVKEKAASMAEQDGKMKNAPDGPAK
jgi:hypothetical protein